MAFQFPDPSVTPEFTGANGITYSWDATDGKWVIKSFAAEDIIGDCATSEDTVCDQLEQLKLGLVEVEEEIESIAPALERGVWLYEQQSNIIRPPNPARYFLLKGYTIGDPLLTGVEFTEEYGEADAVVFSNTEWNLEDENGLGGSTHDWGTVEVGEIIDLFDKPDNDGLFAKITEVNDQIYGNDSILIAFDRIEFLGSPTNNEPYLTRLKIFKEPEGGDAGEFVKKRGDDMTGRLRMERTEEEADFTVPNNLNTAAIRFRNTQPTSGNTSSVCIYQPGHFSHLATSHSLVVKDNVYATGSFKGMWFTDDSNGIKKATNKKAYMYLHGDQTDSALNDQYGALKFNTADRMRWRNNGGLLVYGTPSDTNRNTKLTWNTNRVVINKPVSDSSNHEGFIIKGTTNKNGYASTSSSTNLLYNQSLLNVYHNNGSNDAINYMGKITANSNNIVTTKWVKENVKATVDINCSASGKVKGDMWYCSNDQTLYIKVSD